MRVPLTDARRAAPVIFVGLAVVAMMPAVGFERAVLSKNAAVQSLEASHSKAALTGGHISTTVRAFDLGALTPADFGDNE